MEDVSFSRCNGYQNIECYVFLFIELDLCTPPTPLFFFLWSDAICSRPVTLSEFLSGIHDSLCGFATCTCIVIFCSLFLYMYGFVFTEHQVSMFGVEPLQCHGLIVVSVVIYYACMPM